MTVPSFIAERQADIATLCRRSGARRLDLFGSAARGDFDASRSDLDFVVVLDEQAPAQYFDAYFSLKEGLEALFERPVDLVIERAIRNPFFKKQVESEREPVYAG